ncbi:MAG: hypothetical protein ACQRW7_03185 [Caulobacterales bacterium]|uniref:hypothetical protein n=1 Tax=Glycocaulis sp. TaxID=1969725 RepID=UPI003F9F2676
MTGNSPARPRAAAALFVVDTAAGLFALPALPDALPLAFAPVTRASAVPAGAPADIPARHLGVRSLPADAFTDAALSAAHARLGLLFAAPALNAMDAPARAGLWGRAARHALAPDRQGLSYLGRSVFSQPDGSRWHVRLFAIARAHAVQALFPSTPGGRAVWVSEAELESRLRQPELEAFAALAREAASGMPIKPLHVRNQAGRLQLTGL